MDVRHTKASVNVDSFIVDSFNSCERSDLSIYAFVKLLSSLWRGKDKKGKICPLCRVSFNRMIKSQELDEFIAVRVQDPRVQNERSWTSYVDFKIFLHTNSKAFTAKTSCVRRRYSEFVWLKKKLQKNAGVVPVPDLPPKSVFSFINDDFIERRRKGLQSFLDRVVHMTVCLSDSQLHLFLQTQLPVRHIEDCVQGHTPYTVTEAILNYASSNRGWVQEEEGGAQEMWPAPFLYESVESPAPHVPSVQRSAAASSGSEPPNGQADVSELGQETEREEIHEEERSIHLMNDEDLPGDGSKSLISQMDGPVEVKMGLGGPDKAVDEEMSDGKDVEEITSGIEKKNHGGPGEEQKGRQEGALEQEHTVRQTPPDRDAPEEYPPAQVQNNKAILDLSSAQEEEAKQSDHIGQEPLETADEAVTLLEGTSISEENLSEDQAEAEITHQENEVSDEDLSTGADIHEDAVEDDDVGEVNKINGKSVHANKAILILVENPPLTDHVSETSRHERNLNSTAAGVNMLVLEAIEIDSV